MPSLSIVFAGTPAFACPSLEGIANSQHYLTAVYTQPDRPAGRGRRLQTSPVKQWATDHAIPVYTPQNFKDIKAIETLASLKPDVLVVAAYGLILPQAVLDIPRFGCINVHASLLPRWRGASPIQHAILHGDQQTGVSIMQMEAGLDTGPVFKETRCDISSTDTAASLHDTLAQLGVQPLLETLDALTETPPIIPREQQHASATLAPKISKQQAAILWDSSALDIDRHIRAFNPWPIATTAADDTTLRIHQASIPHTPTVSDIQEPGRIVTIDKRGILVATGNGILCIERLQFPGGKALPISDCLNSNHFPLHIGMLLK